MGSEMCIRDSPKGLPHKIDASRFSGPEHFFAGAPYVFLKKTERRFFDAESTDADASIDRGARQRSKTLENFIAFAICLPNKIDASRSSGPEKCFAGAPLISLKKSNVAFNCQAGLTRTKSAETRFFRIFSRLNFSRENGRALRARFT